MQQGLEVFLYVIPTSFKIINLMTMCMAETLSLRLCCFVYMCDLTQPTGSSVGRASA